MTAWIIEREPEQHGDEKSDWIAWLKRDGCYVMIHAYRVDTHTHYPLYHLCFLSFNRSTSAFRRNLIAVKIAVDLVPGRRCPLAQNSVDLGSAHLKRRRSATRLKCLKTTILGHASNGYCGNAQGARDIWCSSDHLVGDGALTRDHDESPV